MSVQQRLIVRVMCERAEREGLWDMPLREIDLETMADELIDALYNIPTHKGTTK